MADSQKPQILMLQHLVVPIIVGTVAGTTATLLSAYIIGQWKGFYPLDTNILLGVIFLAVAILTGGIIFKTRQRKTPPQLPGQSQTSEPPAPQPFLPNVPRSLGDKFVGRQPDLENLHTLLTANKAVSVAAVAGIGGIGKTRLAAEYATRHRSKYPGGVYWLNADNAAAVGQMVALAATLGLERPPGTDDATMVRRALDALVQKPEPLLLVLDNAEDWNLLKPWADALADAERHRVLLTTRNPALAPTYELPMTRLDVLEEPAALELLFAFSDRRPETDSPDYLAAKSVAERVGYLPLALRLAAGYLNLRRDVFFADYDALLEREGCVKGLDLNTETGERLVKATFQPTWERLGGSQTRPYGDARKVVVSAAFFAPSSIRPDLLAFASGLADEPKPSPFGDAVHQARRLGLLDWEADGRILCHRLIQEFARDALSQEERTTDRTGRKEAAQSVAEALSRLVHVPDDVLVTRLAEIGAERSHLETALEYARAFGFEASVGEFVSDMGRYYRSAANVAEAMRDMSRAVAMS